LSSALLTLLNGSWLRVGMMIVPTGATTNREKNRNDEEKESRATISPLTTLQIIKDGEQKKQKPSGDECEY